MKKRSLAGNVALGLYVLALVFVFIAFFSTNWLVSDGRITGTIINFFLYYFLNLSHYLCDVICFFFIGAKLESFGLWTHCFRSLPDPNDPAERRFFVGCHWIFDPFTKGYDEIKGFLLPCNTNNIYFSIVISPKLYIFNGFFLRSLHNSNSVLLYHHIPRNIAICCWIINVSSMLYP